MIKLDQAVVLDVEILNPLLFVAIEADVLHVGPAGLPVNRGAGQTHLLVAHFGRMETAGRLFQLIRSPISWLSGWVLVALMWQVAHVGALL